MSVGQSAHIQHVACDGRVRLRLLEMGLLPGTEVRVVRRAPMGDPIEIRLRGYSLSIRGTEAAGIDVELGPSESLDAVLSPAE